MANISRSRAHITPLTGLRFVAALSVVISHFAGTWRPGVIPTGQYAHSALMRLAGRILTHISDSLGGLAVSVFFVLSGFILVHVYASGEGRLRGTRRAFYVARFARIYPVYLLGLGIALGPYLLQHQCASGNVACATSARIPVILSSLILTQAWDGVHLLYLNGPGWSLSDEAFFYALFPVLVPLVTGVRRRGLVPLIVGLWVLALLPAVLYAIIRPDGSHVSDPWAAFWFGMSYYAPLLRLPDFVVGMAFGWLFVQRSREGAAVATVAARRVPVVGASIGLLVLTVLVTVLARLVALPKTLDPLQDALLLPAMALLIYTLAWDRGPLARLLGCRPLVALGDASYGLYILHWPLWLWYTRVLHQPSVGDLPRASSLALFVVYVAILSGLSLVSFRFIETPLRLAIRRALPPSGPSTVPLGERMPAMPRHEPAR
jgi:peptidoglycan/LPS O-acetylase OafA/YrhL